MKREMILVRHISGGKPFWAFRDLGGKGIFVARIWVRRVKILGWTREVVYAEGLLRPVEPLQTRIE